MDEGPAGLQEGKDGGRVRKIGFGSVRGREGKKRPFLVQGKDRKRNVVVRKEIRLKG